MGPKRVFLPLPGNQLKHMVFVYLVAVLWLSGHLQRPKTLGRAQTASKDATVTEYMAKGPGGGRGMTPQPNQDWVLGPS